ncbi:MAG: hypothetical protein CMI18_03000 [Opitutaceae bacterium]|nr:hypothetical protein [Opitutaceae bacterium]
MGKIRTDFPDGWETEQPKKGIKKAVHKSFWAFPGLIGYLHQYVSRFFHVFLANLEPSASL